MTHESWNWNGVQDSAVREILRLAEAQLADLHDASIAADQRAAAQAGILVAVGSALLAAAAAFSTRDIPQPAAIWSTLVAGFGMISMAFVTVLTAKPGSFFPGGYDPKALVRSASDEALMLKCIVEDMHDRITYNRRWLARVAWRISIGYLGGLASVVIAVAVFFILNSPCLGK